MNYQKIIYILFVLTIVSCNKTDYKKLSYNQLPNDVKSKFKEKYNYWEPPRVEGKDTLFYTVPFVECYNLDKKCNCEIDGGGGIIRNPFFIFKSCGKKSKISWEVLERIFIIKNDSIYYPYHTQKAIYEGKEFDQVIGGNIRYGESRSYYIKIDTINFRAEKMKKTWW